MADAGRAQQRRAVERKSAILTAARDLMVAEGMHAVTHRRVAEIAGVASGSIRYYFSTREDLLIAGVAALEEQRLVEVRSVLEVASAQLSPQDVGSLLIRTVWGRTTSDRDLIGMVSLAMEGRRESETLSRQLRGWRAALDADVQQVLVRCGFEQVDVALVAAVINGSIVNSAAEGYREVEARAASEVASLLRLWGRAPGS